MGLHSHSDKEKRKRKYAEQFKKTYDNKLRRAKKRENKLQAKRLKNEGI